MAHRFAGLALVFILSQCDRKSLSLEKQDHGFRDKSQSTIIRLKTTGQANSVSIHIHPPALNLQIGDQGEFVVRMRNLGSSPRVLGCNAPESAGLNLSPSCTQLTIGIEPKQAFDQVFRIQLDSAVQTSYVDFPVAFFEKDAKAHGTEHQDSH
jgi:hypothetical protein